MTTSKHKRTSAVPTLERARAAMILIFDSVVMLGELMWLPHTVAHDDEVEPRATKTH